MTLIEAINEVDELCPNIYSQEQKIRWLSRLDGIIKTKIIDTHEGGEAVRFAGYHEKTPLETVLLAPAPYDSIYLLWLEARIHYSDGETTRFNNTNAMYNAEFMEFSNFYNRAHMPKGHPIVFF